MKKHYLYTVALLAALSASPALAQEKALPVPASPDSVVAVSKHKPEIKEYSQTFTVDGFKYGLNEDYTVTLTGYEGDEPTGDLVIPQQISYGGAKMKVTGIGDYAFSCCYGLTSITLPQGLQSIGVSAFNSCWGLKAFTVDEGNTHFAAQDGVLFNKNLSKLIAYPNAKGASYVVPEGVDSIAGGAFSGCDGLTSITLPEGLQSIGELAFSSCSGLTSITLSQGLQSIGDFAFYNCSGLTTITLPQGLQSIGIWAFFGCKGLTSITLPQGLQSIGDEAFSYCFGLTSITLPQGLQSIGKSAFSSCSGLTSITLPQSLQNIGDEAFSYCDRLNYIFILSRDPSSWSPNTFKGIGVSIYVPERELEAFQSKFSDISFRTMSAKSVEISDLNYTTIYAPEGSFFIPEGLTGGIIKHVNEGEKLAVDYKYQVGTLVPADTPILLKGKAGSYYVTMPPKEANLVADTTGLSQNLLRGTFIDFPTSSPDDEEAVFYKLGYDTDGTTRGFYWVNEDGSAYVNKAGEAYLALPKAQYGDVRGFALDDIKDITAIYGVTVDGSGSDVSNAGAKGEAIFTLDGRRVNAESTKGLPAGLYIIGGKKVIVK